MGMSTHVVGFVPPDAKWKQMLGVYNACMAAKVEVPKDVYKFFDGEDPTNMPGREIDLHGHQCVSRYAEESREGYDVDVSLLPANVKIVRMYNSY